ncbi:hypothetical protein [Peribacillus frigoritolerans]|uniref:hypothetical protein n=1 Tax=Peribacillus frigoritolerans TaxID=450367 RepID=UPI0025A114D5|nr:hypothetical protein [Peribacillus frigoritolerans]MDM5305813.1 hypothetical protein [Peribacillus frigoritolerans]
MKSFERKSLFKKVEAKTYFSSYMSQLPKNFKLKGVCPNCSQIFIFTPLEKVVYYFDQDPRCNCPYCGHFNEYPSFFKENNQNSIYIEFDTEIKCGCGVTYALYGVGAYCPNCVVFNSRHLLTKGLERVRSKLNMSTFSKEDEQELIINCLSNIVSLFDGFGRTTVKASGGSDDTINKISFQNLVGARNNIKRVFDYDLASGLNDNEWNFICTCFQKRHLFQHTLGVVDKKYIDITKDYSIPVGRKIKITKDEIFKLTYFLEKIGLKLFANIAS